MILQALQAYESGLCECGHHRSESFDSAHDPMDPEHVARYQAGKPFRCLACSEMARAQRAHAKALGESAEADMAGLKWVAELVPRGLRLA